MEISVKVKIDAPELVSAINNLATALGGKNNITTETNAIAPTQNTPVAVPVASAPQYTIEQIMKAGAALMDAGKIQELRNLIKAFNVDAVTSLKAEQLGAFATELRKLGAQI